MCIGSGCRLHCWVARGLSGRVLLLVVMVLLLILSSGLLVWNTLLKYCDCCPTGVYKRNGNKR
jgi:hypothetical protein